MLALSPATPRSGRIGATIVQWLDSSPMPTWVWERRALLAIEALCHAATVAAAPTLLVAGVLLATSPLATWASVLAQTARSAAARKRERAEARGEAPAVLACEATVERDARTAQLIAVAQPLVALAAAVAGAGGAITVPALAGAAVGAVRVGWATGYGPWRRWMRARRPIVETT